MRAVQAGVQQARGGVSRSLRDRRDLPALVRGDIPGVRYVIRTQEANGAAAGPGDAAEGGSLAIECVSQTI